LLSSVFAQAIAESRINSQHTQRQLMKDWMARAIGALEPYYSSEEYRYIPHSLSKLSEDRLERFRVNEEIRSRLLQELGDKYQQKQQ
jgi:hypothetical protein